MHAAWRKMREGKYSGGEEGDAIDSYYPGTAPENMSSESPARPRYCSKISADRGQSWEGDRREID